MGTILKLHRQHTDRHIPISRTFIALTGLKPTETHLTAFRVWEIKAWATMKILLNKPAYLKQNKIKQNPLFLFIIMCVIGGDAHVSACLWRSEVNFCGIASLSFLLSMGSREIQIIRTVGESAFIR